MKSKKTLVISIIVLAAVMLCSFVGGGVLIAKGAVEAVQDANLPEKFEQLGISDGLNTAMRYAEYFIAGNSVSYNNTYVSDSYTVDGVSAEGIKTLVIENIGYNIVIKCSPRTDVSLSFTGKYPDSVESEELFTCKTNTVNSTMTVKAVDMPGHFDPTVGTVTIYIPNNNDWDIVIKDCMGEIEMSFVNASTLSVENYAGEISAKYLTVDMLKLYAVAGDFEFEGKFGGCVVDNCIGSVEVESSVKPVDNSSIKNCLAEVKITLPGSTSVYIIDHSSYAEIDCNLNESSSGAQFEISNFIGQVIFDED